MGALGNGEGARDFAAGLELRTRYLGVLRATPPDMGASGIGEWVARVFGGCFRPNCAAGRTGRRVQRETERKVSVLGLPLSGKGQRSEVAAGGQVPLKNRWRGRRSVESDCRGYWRAVASTMSRMSVFWLARKSPCKTTTWQWSKPCTGMCLSPNRCRMLLRLSAQLRRP